MESLAQLREHLSQLESLGVNLVCVVQGTPQQADSFCGRHGLAGRCIGDAEKTSYQQMGFPRTSLWKILIGSRDLKRRRKEAGDAGCSNNLEGARQRHSNILQLPGAALISQSGKILWLHRGQHPGDLPLAPELLRIVRENL